MPQITKHFSEEELACPHCRFLSVSEALLTALEATRVAYGKPMHINSACRCNIKNAQVGGVKDSSHLASSARQTTAVDVRCPDSGEKLELMVAARWAGFRQFIIYETFIHMGIDPKKREMLKRGAY